MTIQPNASEIQRFFAQLYPDVAEGWLVLSRPDPDPTHTTPSGKRWLRSAWLNVTQTSLTRIADIAARLSVQDTVYFGVALQHPDCVPDASHRSTNAGAYVVPGLWFDLDLAYGQHAASTLPTTDTEALDFLRSLPAPPSLIVHSGGGLYPFWLFKEPYIITTPAEYDVIKQLAKQFTHTVVMAGKQRGWTLDALGDLARVLRPPGSINFKYGKLVEVIHEGGVRYNPRDFDWLLELPTRASTLQAGAAIAGLPDLATIAEHYGSRLEHKSHTELAGAHPQHGSSTGDNFNVNLDKGLWHCWRHGTGGDALALIAVCEGLVACEDMRAGVLRGALFQHAVAVANHAFQAGITLGGPHGHLHGHAGNGRATTPQTTPSAYDPVEVARQAADALLHALATLADDAKEDAVLDALPDLVPLDMRRWMRLKRQLKTAVPGLNMRDLGQARQELRRAAARQASPAAGRSQAHIAAALAQDVARQLAYDLGRQAWMTYDHGLWKHLETERVTQRIMARMDDVLQGDYTWHTCAGVEHLLRARLAQTLPLETPGWLPFRNGALHLATMQLHPHSPERPFTWQLPHAYEPQATCPQTLAWLHEAVGDAHDQVQVLRAYAKAVVTRRVDLQRYLETIGPGGTGKGTYTRLLMALVGCENTVATELKHLEANRFELSQLRGKVLMVITDAERYSGPVNALKAITGQDFVRMEEKFKAQRTEVAPVMVVVAANEPVQSADYTSGLVRRRLSMAFRHRPAVPCDLLSWHAGAWQGALALEIPGVLNWVLALPDAQMEALLQQTTTLVPSLQATWAQSLVDTNPLAEWANQALLRDTRTEAEGRPLAVVNVGRAHKMDGTNAYEQQDRWLYPHYRAWVDDTGGKPLSSRRFTGLLRDLFENQLRLDGVEHRDGNKGSQFCGIRLRTDSDADQPCLITHHTPPVTDGTPPVTAQSPVSDGCDTCDGFIQDLSQPLSPLAPSVDPLHGTGVPRSDVINHPSQPSHPSLVQGAGVTASVPPATEALAEEDRTVEKRVELVATDGVQQHGLPSQGHAMDRGPDARCATQDAVTPIDWTVTSSTRAAPLDTMQPPPCAVCGGRERREEQGIMRCVRCWPWAGRRIHARADGEVSAAGSTRGDPPCMPDEA
jgi:phage/plasmid-associated DNA primase